MARINIDYDDRSVDLEFPAQITSYGIGLDELSAQLYLALRSLDLDPREVAKKLVAESEADSGA